MSRAAPLVRLQHCCCCRIAAERRRRRAERRRVNFVEGKNVFIFVFIVFFLHCIDRLIGWSGSTTVVTIRVIGFIVMCFCVSINFGA